MKAYELKALLSTLDDSAEVSIELEVDRRDSRHSGYGPWTTEFDLLMPCGVAPRQATLKVSPEALKVVPHALERIEELEKERDDTQREYQDLKVKVQDLLILIAKDREECAAVEETCAEIERAMF